MKVYIAIVGILLVTGCSDGGDPTLENVYTGDWMYTDSEVAVSFTLTHVDGGAYTASNQSVLYNGSNITGGNDSGASTTTDNTVNISLNKGGVYIMTFSGCKKEGSKIAVQEFAYLFNNTMTEPRRIENVDLIRQ